MSEVQSVRESGDFFFSIPIQKIDKEQRLVTGIATAEVVDKAGDIVDYATAKTFFSNPDLWPGNMREMHKPEAVGKAVHVEFDDVNKTVTLTSKVSKGAPQTWEKILDGTLSMYSIGGSGDRKVEKTVDGKIAKRLFLTKLAEVSYVDNGANPLAKFDVIKAAMAEEEKVEVVEDVKKDGPEQMDINQALQAISSLNSLCSNEYWEARYAASQGDAEEEIAQVSLLRSATSLVIDFLRREFDEQFKATLPDAPPSLAPINLDTAVEMALKAQDVVKAGARHSKSDNDKIQAVHDHAVALGAMCTDVQKNAAVSAAAKAEAIVAKEVEKVEETKVEEVKKEDTAVITTLESADNVSKLETLLTDTLTVIKAQSVTLQEQGEKLVKLNAELDSIKKMAMPGGPVKGATAVEKKIGDAPDEPIEKVDTFIDALTQIAEKGDKDVKKAAAEAIVKLQQTSGFKRIDFKV